MRLTTAALAATLAIAFTVPAFAAKKCNAHSNGQSVMGKCVSHESDRHGHTPNAKERADRDARFKS